MGAAVIAGCDAPPVLVFSKHVLNFMALFVEVHVIFDLPLAIFPWRNAGLDPFVLQGFPEPIGVIAAIGEKVFGWRQGVDNQPGAFVIAHLPH